MSKTYFPFDEEDIERMQDILNNKADDRNDEIRILEHEIFEEVHTRVIRERLIQRINKEKMHLDTGDAESHIWYGRMEDLIMDVLKEKQES